MGLPFPAMVSCCCRLIGKRSVVGCCTREMREAISEGATAGRYFQPAEPHDSPERSRRAPGNFFSITCEREHSHFSLSPEHSHLPSRQDSASLMDLLQSQECCCFYFKVVASRLCWENYSDGIKEEQLKDSSQTGSVCEWGWLTAFAFALQGCLCLFQRCAHRSHKVSGIDSCPDFHGE